MKEGSLGRRGVTGGGGLLGECGHWGKGVTGRERGVTGKEKGHWGKERSMRENSLREGQYEGRMLSPRDAGVNMRQKEGNKGRRGQ